MAPKKKQMHSLTHGSSSRLRTSEISVFANTKVEKTKNTDSLLRIYERAAKREATIKKKGKEMHRATVSQIERRKPVSSNIDSVNVPGESDHDEKDYDFKFSYGVNTWKRWVTTKNFELENSSARQKLFKTELLQLTADELNSSLCLFVKEIRKLNGNENAPDSIYYFVLGIQKYLLENGRMDNIFTDPCYERFTDCLDEVAKKFDVLGKGSQQILTRVEEAHLWECKQLGAHSPHILLNTLVYLNMVVCNKMTVEEHMQLTFSSSGLHVSAVKMYENKENRMCCPTDLYAFYLSKCPKSAITRNDVFYLLPEQSCVPDSPVWYSTQALGKEALSKMLHRAKMIKEVIQKIHSHNESSAKPKFLSKAAQKCYDNDTENINGLTLLATAAATESSCDANEKLKLENEQLKLENEQLKLTILQLRQMLQLRQTPEKFRFECTSCAFKTNKKSTFDTHIESHNPAKNRTCKICKASFSRRKLLQHLQYMLKNGAKKGKHKNIAKETIQKYVEQIKAEID